MRLETEPAINLLTRRKPLWLDIRCWVTVRHILFQFFMCFFFFFMQRDQNERSASDRTGQDQVKVAVERSKLVTEVKPVS